MIYNEGFAEFAGSKHPRLMGRSPKTEYAEVWAMFEDIIQRGRTTGKATRHKDVQLFLNRANSGWLEETFVTYTFIPIIGPDKTVSGFYHTATETTGQVLSARRTKTLLVLGDHLTTSRSLQDYWENLLKALEEHNQDMHWALAYSFANDGAGNETGSGTQSSAGNSSPSRIPRGCTLAGATTKAVGKVPLSFDRQDESDAFTQVIKKSMRSGETALLQNTDLELPEWIFELGAESTSKEECRSALLIPIRPTTKNEADGGTVIGFLLVGIAATRRYDKDLAQFVQLFGRQLDTSAASIMLLEQEIRRQQQLTEQLSTSTKQAQELEKKFSRFAEISNLGLQVISSLVLAIFPLLTEIDGLPIL
jgi:GAF domain-containing protein